jgi:hypothetical protein
MACDLLTVAPIEIKLSEDDVHQQKEINFFNLHELTYRPGTSVPDFYNQYRNLISAVLRKKDDIVIWQNDRVLLEDEELSPTFEEMILINVLHLIHRQLPGHVRDYYQHLSGKSKWLMDNKSDIFVKIPTFLSEVEGEACYISESDVKFER